MQIQILLTTCPSVVVGKALKNSGAFPGGPLAKTPCSQCRAVSGQGTRFHLPQLTVHIILQVKILPAATNTWHSQINKYLKNF